MKRPMDKAHLVRLVRMASEIYSTEHLKAQADERRKLWEAMRA